MALHPIQGGNRWWGPSAIAAITGISTDRAAKMIREDTGRRGITHTNDLEVRRCLYQLGYDSRMVTESGREERLTVAAWLKTREHATGIYLAYSRGRWIVARGRKMADANHREPVFLKAYKQRRCRVSRVWLVVPIDAK